MPTGLDYPKRDYGIRVTLVRDREKLSATELALNIVVSAAVMSFEEYRSHTNQV